MRGQNELKGDHGLDEYRAKRRKNTYIISVVKLNTFSQLVH